MEKSHLHIGILELGERTTAFYLYQLNKQYAPFSEEDKCPIIVHNVDFDTLNTYLPNSFKKLESLLSEQIEKVEALGVDYLLIPNITLHETFDRLKTNINIAHPVQLTINQLIEKKQTQAVVFASLHTMESTYLKNAFQQKGIELIEPTKEDKYFIEYIRTQVYNEQETDDEVEKYSLLLAAYSKKQPVLIACTELSILISTSQNNIFDMAQTQIEETLQQL